jgi:phosphopantothenoylcysteine decarboxylase/phosphopantothenate--cysteine ligase
MGVMLSAAGSLRWFRDTFTPGMAYDDLLAPATANLIARLAAGLADELLPALCLVVRCPMLICPAMNSRMWEHPATQRNVATLRGFGYHLLGPATGELACGMSGPGRMVEPSEIVAASRRLLASAQPPAPKTAPRSRSRRRRAALPTA